MLARVRRHLNHGTIVAYVALFVALGGVSHAAIRIPGNSVGSKQLRNNAVTSAKVKNHDLAAQSACGAGRRTLGARRGICSNTNVSAAAHVAWCYDAGCVDAKASASVRRSLVSSLA
jgi:hypothetical protein